MRSLTWLKKGKGNEQCACPTTHTLFQCNCREMISHFKTLLPVVATAKSVKVHGLKKMLLPASTQVSKCYC